MCVSRVSAVCQVPSTATKYVGGDLLNEAGQPLITSGSSPADCCTSCSRQAACAAYTFDVLKSQCWLKTARNWTVQRNAPNFVSSTLDLSAYGGNYQLRVDNGFMVQTQLMYYGNYPDKRYRDTVWRIETGHANLVSRSYFTHSVHHPASNGHAQG